MLNLPKVLLFADDAGAANYVASARMVFESMGFQCVILAEGPGSIQLASHGVTFALRKTTDSPELCVADKAIVAIGTSSRRDTFGLRLIDAARQFGVPSIGFIDAAQNLEWRFRGLGTSPLAHPPDWIAVPDSDCINIFHNLGFPISRVRVCGHPHYDRVRDDAKALIDEGLSTVRQRVFPVARPGQRIVVFASSPQVTISDDIPLHRNSSYTLTGTSGTIDRTEIVAEEVLAAIRGVDPGAFVVFRHHPAATHLYHKIAACFDMISQGGLPVEILMAADLVIGSTTMLLHEAVMCGRPALSVVPRTIEATWLPASQCGLIECVTDRLGLRLALRRFLENPVLPDSTQVERLFPHDCKRLLRNLIGEVVSDHNSRTLLHIGPR